MAATGFAVLAAAVLASVVSNPSSAPSPSPAPSAAPADRPATFWYDAARDRWKTLPRSPYAAYDVDIVATIKGKRTERKEREWFRASDATCLDVGVALDAKDRPDPPQVTKSCFGPDYAFELFDQKRSGGGAGGVPIEIASAGPSAAPSGEPRTIGEVSARSRPYALALVGDETVDGVDAVHLKLTPFADPDHHVLRDLWIDRSSFAVVRLAGEARGAAGLARATFEADYAQSPAAQLLTAVTGYVKAQLAFLKIGADFSYALTNLTLPETLPDWCFDQRAYDAHERTEPGSVCS
jgi:hypothetical protein